MKTTNETKQCGTRIYHSGNCHNHVRKVAQNKFENIYLCGKHAFSYSVITENKVTKQIKETMFPNRKEALCFFMMVKSQY